MLIRFLPFLVLFALSVLLANIFLLSVFCFVYTVPACPIYALLSDRVQYAWQLPACPLRNGVAIAVTCIALFAPFLSSLILFADTFTINSSTWPEPWLREGGGGVY